MPLQTLETLSDVTSCRKSCYSSISSSCFYTKANHDKETQLITDGGWQLPQQSTKRFTDTVLIYSEELSTLCTLAPLSVRLYMVCVGQKEVLVSRG